MLFSVKKESENENLNEINNQFAISSVETDVREDNLLLKVNESETKNHDIYSPLLVENSELIKMLAIHIASRVKKKSLSTVFKHENPINELSILIKDWLSSISKGSLIKPSRKWLEIVFKMKEDFIKFHDRYLVKKKMWTTLTTSNKNLFSETADFAVTCYAWTSNFIRMKYVIREKKKNQKRDCTV